MSTFPFKVPDPQVLRTAADVVRENGLHKGNFFKSTVDLPPSRCPVCVMGAVNVAMTGHPVDRRLKAVGVNQFLASVLGGSLPEWNDKPERTEADVLDLLTRAASAAESALAAQDGGESRG